MSLREFRAWLEGYSASIGDAPTPEQWAAIKAKLELVGALSFGTGYLPNQLPLTGARLYPLPTPQTTCNAVEGSC